MWQASDSSPAMRGANERRRVREGDATYPLAVCHLSARLSSDTACLAAWPDARAKARPTGLPGADVT